MKTTRAIVILSLVICLGLLVPGKTAVAQQTAGELFEKALYVEEGQGDLPKAIGLYQDIVKRFAGEREIAAKAQLHIGLCYEKLGLAEAQKAFQKVVSDFPEQAEAVNRAREKLSAMVRAKAVLDTAEKVLSVRMIWSGLEAGSASYISPDGRSLSYVEEESGNLCIRDIASGKRTVVVRKAQADKPYQFPLVSRWSPDGKSLVYAWFNMDNTIELRTIGVDGSGPRTLYSRKNEMAFPAAWSPDGRSIAAVVMRDYYTSFNLGLISVEDGSLKILKTLTRIKASPMSMVFSRDGRFLLVDLPQMEGDHKHDIFALSVDGAGEYRVVEHPENDTVLGWIPGSDTLLFLSSRTGTYDAWTVGISDGHAHGQPRLVRKNLGLVTPLGISPEGSLYYSVGITMSEIFTASVDLDKGGVIEPPKIVPQPLVGADEQPQWSPDGKSLAFFSKEKSAPGTRQRMALKIRSEETGETREVKTTLEWLARSSWAPDGRSLFVIGSDGEASLAIFQVDVKTGRATLVIDSEAGANIKFIAPARDGRSVYYTYFEFGKKRARVMGIDLASRETRELYRQDAPPDIGGLSVSPDGKELLFGTLAPDNSLVLKAVPLPEGGTPREVIRSKAGGFGVSVDVHGGYGWAPDGKRIIFFKEVSAADNDEKCELSAAPIAGGPIQGLGLVVDGGPDVISLHPDGRRIAYAVSRDAAEVWVMENFLPTAPGPADEGGPSEYRVTRIPTDPAVANVSFISPDGEKLALAGVNGDVWVRDIAAGKDKQLTKTPDFEYWCFWSPDSRRIAYIDHRNIISIISVDGGEPVTLVKPDSEFLKSVEFFWPTGWTPDGNAIICHVSGRGLCAIPIDGGAWKDVFPIPTQSNDNDFPLMVPSPDNRWVAYALPTSGNGDIFLSSVAGGEQIQVTDHPSSEEMPTWSWDGKYLAFMSGRSGEKEIWAVRISPEGRPEGEPIQVSKSGTGRNAQFGWTRRGSIGISRSPIVQNLFLNDRATGKESQLTKMLTNDQRPRWSPDGTRIAYLSENAGKWDIWVVKAEGGEPRLVTGSFTGRAGIGLIRGPVWLPDCKSLAFVVFAGADDNRGIWVIPAEGGEPRKVDFNYEGSILNMDWSPDGKAIAFEYNGRVGDKSIKGSRIYEGDIYVIPVGGGEPRRITQIDKTGFGFIRPRWSPDGKKIAFLSDDWSESAELNTSRQIWVADLETGNIEQISTRLNQVWMGVGWAADGGSIYYSARINNKDCVFSIPIKGGEPKNLGIEGTFAESSPDGTHLVYSRMLAVDNETWLIENFLPPGKK